jgi:hypothetical protein
MTAPIQGLKVDNTFSDARDPIEVLNNLNLDIRDLNRIRGISGEAVSAADIRTLSGLTVDIEKQAIAIFNETRSYQNILSILNDGRKRIEGNLDLSGSIVAPTFKFRTVDFNANNEIRTVDFSTSRNSAWSSFGDSADSIFYGGDVKLSGNNSTIELSSLEFVESPSTKRFASQIPTHKLRIRIDNEEYDLYAMKGIPLRFRGFFRSVRNLQVSFNHINNIPPSWIIRNVRTDRETVFQNRSTGTALTRQSTISFFDSVSSERDIEFYYPVDSIRAITLNDARIFELPNVVLPELLTLNLINGDLIEMPEIGRLFPKITSLNLSENNLTRSNDVGLRTLTQEVIARLRNQSGSSIQTLILDRVYSNVCTGNFGDPVNGLPSLRRFRADSSGTNSRRMTGTSPGIPSGMIEYNINGNNFNALHSSVLGSNTLQILNIRANSISGTLNATNLTSIQTFISGANSHAIVNLSGKTELVTYQIDGQTFPSNGNIGTDVFNGCTNLRTIRINNTNVTGNLPNFTTNVNLNFVASWSTQWRDANTNNFSIDENTFGPDEGGCRATLGWFNLQSPNLSRPLHPRAFRNMPNLRSLVISSYDRGITGSYPISLNECFNLRNLQLPRNRMSGPLPSFSGNGLINTINLERNLFSGSVPPLNLSNLANLLLQNNQLTDFQGLNCPNMTQLNASFNQINSFPDLNNCIRLQLLFLNSNNGIGYTNGSLVFLSSLRRVEIANCGLNQGQINRILIDLNENYNLNPRGNVTVILTGNASPSSDEQITLIISRLRREGWTLALS